jgi:hypothetical protein
MNQQITIKTLDYLSLEKLKEDSFVPKGSIVFIPANTEWHSMNPSNSIGITRKDLLIRDCKQCSIYTKDFTWAGSGGYWKWTEKANCFIIPADKQ